MSYLIVFQLDKEMKQYRNEPESGFHRGRGSPRGDPNLGINNRSRAPSIMLLFCYLTGYIKPYWESLA